MLIGVYFKTYKYVKDWQDKLLKAIHLRYELYGTHSFRRGGCQYYHSYRNPPLTLRQLAQWGGWSTDFKASSIFRYLHGDNDLEDKPRELLLRPAFSSSRKRKLSGGIANEEQVAELQKQVAELKKVMLDTTREGNDLDSDTSAANQNHTDDDPLALLRAVSSYIQEGEATLRNLEQATREMVKKGRILQRMIASKLAVDSPPSNPENEVECQREIERIRDETAAIS